jgi:hypothetical protein
MGNVTIANGFTFRYKGVHLNNHNLDFPIRMSLDDDSIKRIQYVLSREDIIEYGLWYSKYLELYDKKHYTYTKYREYKNNCYTNGTDLLSNKYLDKLRNDFDECCKEYDELWDKCEKHWVNYKIVCLSILRDYWIDIIDVFMKGNIEDMYINSDKYQVA